MGSELSKTIEMVGKEKGIGKIKIISALEEAVAAASKKKFGANKEIEAHYNEETGEIEVFQFFTVVEQVEDPDLEMSLEEARKYDPECTIGDSLGVKLDISGLGRIAAQTAKQIIIQKVRDAEREVVYSEYKDRKGTIVSGIVHRFDKGDIIVNLGRAEAILPHREQVPKESYRQGDRIRGIIIEVHKEGYDPQIVISRTHPNFLIKLFEQEVPEIEEGIVEIKGVAREPGIRSKIAVYSRDPKIDPVGACVGMKGTRVQAIVQELKGEKLDIVKWSNNAYEFVCNALAPAQIYKGIVDEEERTMELVVPDDQLSLAIGKRGINVRLAAKLTGWKIDVKSESRVERIYQEGRQALKVIPGVGDMIAQILFQEGYKTPADVAKLSVKELQDLTGLSEEEAQQIIERAKEVSISGGQRREADL